jgi:hypothetical protein
MEEVSIMKSVPNLISYHHEVFRNFSQFLAIFIQGEFFYFRKQLMRGAQQSAAVLRRAVP